MISTARRGVCASSILLIVALGSCAEPQAPPPALPSSAVVPPPPVVPPAPPAKEDAFAVKGPFRPDLRPAAPSRDVSTIVSVAAHQTIAWKKAVPTSSPICKPYLEKPRKKPAIPCDTFLPSGEGKSDGAGTLLLSALSEADAPKRDALLRELAACKGIAQAELVALRATLGPPECADAIVAPVAESPVAVAALDKRLAHPLVGLWLSGQLARTVPPIPRMSPPFTKDAVIKFTNGPIRLWFSSQATAVDELSKLGATLEGQGRAIVAIEAGLADMRFVERARDVPMPDEWKKDPEIAQVYQASLDQAMEPRKLRGRDAALTGLNDSASLGILQDARISRARVLLSKLYGGSRIDALDGLILPPAHAEPTNATLAQKLSGRLPLGFGERLLGAKAHDASVLGAVSTQGLPAAFRGKDGAPEGLFDRIARVRIDLAKVYFRGAEADQVLSLAEGRVDKLTSPEARFYIALALALRHGPEGAAAMMKAASPAALELRHTAALDELAAGSGPYAGIAAFDAAWLRQLSPPSDASAEYFGELAKRFVAAEAKLTNASDKAKAKERAILAEETSKIVR